MAYPTTFTDGDQLGEPLHELLHQFESSTCYHQNASEFGPSHNIGHLRTESMLGSEDSIPTSDGIILMEGLDNVGVESANEQRHAVPGVDGNERTIIYDDIPAPLVSDITFGVELQRRPGSAHGMGGRPRAIMDEVRRTFGARCIALISFHLCGLYGGGRALSKSFLQTILHMPFKEVAADHYLRRDTADLLETEGDLCKLFESHSKLPRKGLEVIYGPRLAICAKFSASTRSSVMQGIDANVKERHTCCTWIDKSGNVRCSCIGSTEFRFRSLSETFHDACCRHSESIVTFLEVLATKTSLPASSCGKVIGDLVRSRFTADESDYLQQLPLFTYAHDEKFAIINMQDELVFDLQYIPIRCVRRAGIHFLCAFCDVARANQCEHTVQLHSLILHGGPAIPSNSGSDYMTRYTRPRETDMDPMAGIIAVSHLPLSIVNCKESIRMDRVIIQLSQGNQCFFVSAPKHCLSCNGDRDSTSRRIQNGLVLTSEGPCAMKVETFKCINGSCRALIHSEGRDHYILLLSLSTAGTHVFLRRQLTGVALSNGTLSGRLSQYHSQMLANIDADLVPGTTYGSLSITESKAETLRQLQLNEISGLVPKRRTESSLPPEASIYEAKIVAKGGGEDLVGDSDTGSLGLEKKWRSIRVMEKLCVAMCKLMVISPPSDLFRCSNCEDPDGRLHCLCCDGIWVGYCKISRRMFRNVSELCQAMPTSKAASATKRPLTSLLRREQTVRFLLQGIRGNNSTVSNNTLACLVAAIRVVNPNVLPVEYHSESICGNSPKYFLDDIGDCVLGRVRKLITTLFAERILCDRLCWSLLNYLTNFPRSALRKKRRTADSEAKFQNLHNQVMGVLQNRLQGSDPTNGQGICWALVDVLADGSASKCFEDIFLLFRALVQGPVTQMITRAQLPSLFKVAAVCAAGASDTTEILCALSKENADTPNRDENVISFFRLMRGGLLRALELEALNPGLIAAFGESIHDMAVRIQEFYDFYDTLRPCSASAYSQKWGGGCDAIALREKYLQIPLAGGLEGGGKNLYAQACRTGVFFPGYEQLRPLPFNDELNHVQPGSTDLFGVCSKTYLQQKKSFTPGALTLCCSCSTPIILGLKVLEKHEGPRSVLDIIISRFAKAPRHIVYDFACGLYTCAIHNLWWAMEDTTVVSDAFHAGNHNCSPSYIPSAHAGLNMSNTVSHEQRNRGIGEISRSLRSTSQEFYIALLAFQMSILNLKAKAKGHANFDSREMGVTDGDLEWCFFQCIGYKCECC